MSDVIADMVTAAVVRNPAFDTPPARSAPLLTRRGRRLKKRQQQRLEENSNAVVCPNFFEKLDRRLSKEDGSPTAFTWFVRSIGVILPLPAPLALGAFASLVAQDEHNAQTALVTLWYSCFCVSVALMSLVQIEQLRRVIRPGEHLEQLGVGTQKISERALADLNKWQTCWLMIPKSVGVALLLAEVAWNYLSWRNLLPTVYFLYFGLFFGVVLPLFCDWWMTLKTASALTSDSTLEVVHAAATIAPKDANWHEKVAEPAKRLARITMDELSDGWGFAVAIAYVVCWLLSMSFFSLVMWTIGSTFLSVLFFRYIGIIVMVTFALLPLLMSADPADVSSSCDELLAEFNVQRGMDDSLETHEKLLRLETFLNSLNNREGLGFVAGGNVLDKRRLGRMIGGVFGLFATVVPFLVTLQTSENEALTTVFGQMHNDTTVYAYSPVPRTAEQSKAYCESLWMQMATVHNQATQDALFSMQNPAANPAYLGATYSTDNGDWSGVYEWHDGSPFDYSPGCEEEAQGGNSGSSETCPHGVNQGYDPQPDARLVTMDTGDGGWRSTRDVFLGGVFCMADSLESLRPGVRRLDGPTVEELTDEDAANPARG